MKRAVLVALLVAALVLAGCGGGGSDPVNPPIINPPGDGGGTTDTGLVGTLDVAGIPVVDPAGGEGDVTKVSLKIIDPSEDIGDSPGIEPKPDGGFSFPDVEPAIVKYLNVDFDTPLDLTGTGLTATTISINIPVQIATGVLTTVNTSIEVFTPQQPASLKSPSETDVSTIEISYEYSGPDGKRSVKYIINFRTGTTVYDHDDDGSYDDEPEYEDGDHDGIWDDREEEDQHHNEFTEVREEGFVTAIGVHFITVNGVTFIIDDRTSYKHELKHDEISIGSEVRVEGYETPSGSVYAEEIEDRGDEEDG